MKKLKTLLAFLVFMTAMVATHAQTGATCSGAITTPIGSLVSDSLPDQVKWYKFTAADSIYKIALHNLSDTTAGHIHKMSLYSGTCSSLHQIGTEYLWNDTVMNVLGYKDSLVMYVDSIIPGQTYYIKLQRGADVGTGCRICSHGSGATLNFNLRISSLTILSSASLTFSGGSTQDIYQFPGCNTVYTGMINGASAGKNYRINVSQAGPFNFFNTAQDWVVVNGNIQAVDNAGNTHNFSAPGSSATVYLNGRVPCNTPGGSVDVITLTLQRHHLFGWQTESTATVIIHILNSAVASATSICPGTVNLSGFPQYPNLNYSYSWTPTAGVACPTCQNTIATVTTTTTFTLNVTLTSNVSVCCPVITDYETVNVDQPLPSFTTNDNEICVGNQWTFTNTSSNSTSYTWNFGDGSATSTATNPTHTYNYPGQYTVTLYASNSMCSSSTQMLVSVTPSSNGYNSTCCTNTENYKYKSIHIQTAADVTAFLNSFTNNPYTGWSSCTIRDTLFLEGNQTMTLTSKELGFGPWGKIIVEKGSRLIFDHCFVTTAGKIHDIPPLCPFMWQGVEVRGDITKTQTAINPATGTLYQGKVEVKNNTTIRDAHNGIVAGKWLGHSYDPNGGGGIILASTNSKFINNGYDFRFTPYPYVNNSRVTNCTVMCGALDDPGYNSSNSYTYPNPYNQQYAIANANQRTYAFVLSISNKFIAFDDNTFNGAEYGAIGINSSLRFSDINSNGSANFFQNTTNGETHANIFSSPFYANTAEHNRYTGNLVPISTWAGLGDKINFNDVPSGAFVGIGNVSSGSIYVNDNTITGAFIGVSTSNTGSMGGLIGYISLGNTFTKCTDGTYLGSNNPYLQVHCNNYTNPSAATYNVNLWNFGPLANQGTLPILTDKDPAGNTFVQFTPLRNQIGATVLFDYYAHSADASGNPVTVIPTPTASLTAGNVINTGIQMTTTSCDPGPPCNNCGNRIAHVSEQIDAHKDEKASLISKLDRGKTNDLLAEIADETINPSVLESDLLANFPLSDQVLYSVITSPNVSKSAFISVVIANSPVSRDIRAVLFGVIAGMDSTIQDTIIAAQANYSNRTVTVVDDEMQALIGERQQLYNQEISYYVEKSETDSTARDSVYIVLNQENTEAAKQAIAASYLSEGNYSAAASAINALSDKSDADKYEKEILTLLYHIYSSGRDIFSMTGDEVDEVRTYAAIDYECLARTQARVILFAAFGEPLDLGIENPEGRYANNAAVTEDHTQAFLGTIYPNPASNQALVDCNVPENAPGILRIFDMNGKEILTVQLVSGKQTVSIDTHNWPAGVYMCSLESGDTRLGMEKLIIVQQK